MNVDVLLSPAEYETASPGRFADHVCVVFDVLRATSVVVTGLAHGVRSFIPVLTIEEAVQWRRQQPDVLLAGERDGLRIGAALGGGVDFDLGNSPREYQPARVAGKDIVTTTTNGTRALRACLGAQTVLAAALLNLGATAQWLQRRRPSRLLLVGAGTGHHCALEDALAAGALLELLASASEITEWSDAAQVARAAYRQAAGHLHEAIAGSRNGSRLLANPDLCADVEFCLRRDVFAIVAQMQSDGRITRAV
ncbi:MAG TPA: 2-phosphosulfolactate phosphatase [Verrucomicrobiota bacterium]|nr:2-phosphosulfolactate phosphatase [Verrucomicrobiota bacterium]HNT14811.1 2-phosphosulfolactate phosphatase [Verrucomicrobiota bacterium]